jgi:hypothetical protein
VHRRISLDSVRTGIIAVLVLVFALHAGLSCGVGQAIATIEAPCCGDRCPTPSAGGDKSCCQRLDSSLTAQVASAKPHMPSLPTMGGMLSPSLALPALSGIVQTSASWTSPPGALKLALLCSRQI